MQGTHTHTHILLISFCNKVHEQSALARPSIHQTSWTPSINIATHEGRRRDVHTTHCYVMTTGTSLMPPLSMYEACQQTYHPPHDTQRCGHAETSCGSVWQDAFATAGRSREGMARPPRTASAFRRSRSAGCALAPCPPPPLMSQPSFRPLFSRRLSRLRY